MGGAVGRTACLLMMIRDTFKKKNKEKKALLMIKNFETNLGVKGLKFSTFFFHKHKLQILGLSKIYFFVLFLDKTGYL